MSSLLISLGFKHVESLKEFSTRYPNISHNLDDDLEKIWICHKHFQDIPKFGEISLNHGYFEFDEKISKKIDHSQDYLSSQSKIDASSIFKKIYHHFQGSLSTYILMKCFVFYNWGNNAFEPVFDHNKIQAIIENNIKRKKKKVCTRKNCKNAIIKEVEVNSNPKKLKRVGSVDLFDEFTISEHVQKKKKVSYKVATQNTEPFVDLPRNLKDPSQEYFNLNKILYDMHQKPQWPTNHILSQKDVDKLLLFITGSPVGSSVSTETENECKNWVKLRNSLGVFMKKHETVEKNNGYGRILKKHLKKVKTTPNIKLTQIPKTTVASYILDILRKVLPLELFGTNRLKKKFYSSIVKIISGSKNETFIWYPLLQVLFENKSEIPWCSEINDGDTQTLIILKVFRFIVIHYVFVILKNNFYVTETGSSGFGLRFYRKGDVESVSSSFSDSLLRTKYMRPLKKRDYNLFSIERKWVNTGVIDDKDLTRDMKLIIDDNSEFKQAIARVRFLPKNDWSDDIRIITNIKHKPSGSRVIPATSENLRLEQIFKNRFTCRQKTLYFIKLLLEFLVDKIEFGIKPVPNNPNLKAAWNKAIQLKTNFEKLYFVKADIADAFGSVDYRVLMKILKQMLAEEIFGKSIRLRKITEWRRTRWKIKKTSRVSFSDRPKENSVLVSRSFCDSQNEKLKKIWNRDFLHIIKQVVMDQRVEVKGRVLKLIKGLAQGSVGKFSPKLCEIYYSNMDRDYFRGLINSNNYVFLRGVDDYLLITPFKEKAERFLKIIRGGIREYNVEFNSEKLKSNLIEEVHEVSYLGLIFNFNDMSVKPNYSKFLQKDLLSTMKLSDARGKNHFDKVSFLETRSLNIDSLKLQPILLDKKINNLKTVRQTVFQACLMQSLRVMTLAKYLFPGRTKNDLILSQILLKNCNKIKNWVIKCSILTKEEVHWLFYFGALCIFQKFSGQFKHLLAIVRFKLENIEKTFIKDGSELLLEILKDDLYEEEFWKEVTEIFGKMAANTKPFNSKTLKKNG